MVKNLPRSEERQEMQVQSLGQEDPLDKDTTTHSSILAWENPMDRGAWWATGHGVTEADITEHTTHPIWWADWNNIANTLSWFLLCVCAQSLSPVWLFVTSWTVAYQAPLSMGFPRQEYWSGLPFPPSGDLLNLGIELTSPASLALAGGFFTTEPPKKTVWLNNFCLLIWLDTNL